MYIYGPGLSALHPLETLGFLGKPCGKLCGAGVWELPTPFVEVVWRIGGCGLSGKHLYFLSFFTRDLKWGLAQMGLANTAIILHSLEK